MAVSVKIWRFGPDSKGVWCADGGSASVLHRRVAEGWKTYCPITEEFGSVGCTDMLHTGRQTRGHETERWDNSEVRKKKTK